MLQMYEYLSKNSIFAGKKVTIPIRFTILVQ